MKRILGFGLVLSAGLFACDGSETSDNASGGGGSSDVTSASNGTGTGTTASGSTTGSSPTSSSTGDTTSGGGAGGGQSTDVACDDFPATVELGDTYTDYSKGALLCFDDDGSLAGACELTTTEKSGFCADSNQLHIQFLECQDGVPQCPDGARDVWLKPTSGMDYVNWSAGTPGLNGYLGGLPANEPITLEIQTLNGMYTVVFEFDGQGSLTVTSFEPS